MNIKDIVEEPVNKIWKKYPDLTDVSPLAVSEVPENGIIFVGINPSINDKDRERLSKIEDKSIEFYDNPASVNAQALPYFRKFETISNEIALPWGHIDLLYIRETSQNKINDLIENEKSISFIFDQTRVTRNLIDVIIKDATPKAFVVNNTLARGLLGRYKTRNGIFPENIPLKQIHWVNYLFEWDEECGTFFLEGTKIPFFFSGMLTGQRALDNSSFERLVY